jgi:DNA invertase Pin-like site-specific DNA recombinase
MEGRYVAYHRVSTDRQGRSGLGLEAQKVAVLTFLDGGGWKLVAEYTEVETGRSPARLTLAKRPQLQAAIAEAKKRKATLVIARLDRLARSVAFIANLMETGVDFRAADMPNADKFMLHVYAAMAEEEGRRIAARTKAALQAAKKRGTKLGRAAENKTAAETFARKLRPVIRELRKEGVTTVRGIAEELNKRGVETPRGGRWHATSVERVLGRLRGR